MSPTHPTDDAPDVADLLDLAEQLDVDNERLRVRALELMRLMEEAVDAQVAGERRIAELEDEVAALRAQLERPFRRRVGDWVIALRARPRGWSRHG